MKYEKFYKIVTSTCTYVQVEDRDLHNQCNV